MSVVSDIRRVAALQLEYSHKNTAAMKERGKLIRHGIPEGLSQFENRLSRALGEYSADFSIEGKDGIGRKTQAPWVRIFSKELSPQATIGFYVVIHFSLDGKRCYTTLGCASSRWDNGVGDLVKYSSKELQKKVNWAKDVLHASTYDWSSFNDIIRLGSNLPLPKSFEKATIAAMEHTVDRLVEETFVSSVEYALQLLKTIYDAYSQLNDLSSSEIDRSSIESIINPNRRTSGARQGFGLTAPERRAVELRAMKIAVNHLESLGYSTVNTSSNRPYDLLAKRGEEEIIVEVKGTTSSSVDSILMTANEVDIHKALLGKTALAIVSNIKLTERGDNPKCSGGELEYTSPWNITKWITKPISYQVGRPQEASD